MKIIPRDHAEQIAGGRMVWVFWKNTWLEYNVLKKTKTSTTFLSLMYFGLPDSLQTGIKKDKVLKCGRYSDSTLGN